MDIYEKFGIYKNETTAEFTQLVQKEQLNGHGILHGGEICKVLDDLAAVSAVKYFGGRFVTVSFNKVDIMSISHKYDLLRGAGTVIYVGNTSCLIEITLLKESLFMFAEGDTPEPTLVAKGYITMVKMDPETSKIVPLGRELDIASTEQGREKLELAKSLLSIRI